MPAHWLEYVLDEQRMTNWLDMGHYLTDDEMAARKGSHERCTTS